MRWPSASRTGAETQTDYVEDVAYGPSETMLGDRHVLPMTEEHIERVIQAYADAAALAMRAGFGMIFIHAGHGWLFHQFLSPVTNKRTDKWGGTPENRARFLVNTLDAIHARIGRGVPIEVRMSGSEGYEGGYGIETGIDIANVYDNVGAYDHVAEMGENVVIIGGGMSGLEQAIYLGRSCGKNVTVVARHDVKDGGNNMHMMAVNFEIMEHDNIKVMLNTATKEITAEGVRIVDSEGVESVLPADAIIYATGMKARRDETIALYDCAPEFYPVGDCCLPKNMAEANMTAYTEAEDLGTF